MHRRCLLTHTATIWQNAYPGPDDTPLILATPQTPDRALTTGQRNNPYAELRQLRIRCCEIDVDSAKDVVLTPNARQPKAAQNCSIWALTPEGQRNSYARRVGRAICWQVLGNPLTACGDRVSLVTWHAAQYFKTGDRPGRTRDIKECNA
jgi:hypothetical protein